MRKHRANRSRRQGEGASGTGKVNSLNSYRCTSHRCRRARKCLGQATVCACTSRSDVVATNAEKLRMLRQSFKVIMAQIAREDARAAARGEPQPYNPYEDPNVDPLEKEMMMREEINRVLKEQGLD